MVLLTAVLSSASVLSSPRLRQYPKRYQQPYERQCQHQPTDRIRKKCQRFAKLKEVQADTQSQRYCTTFNFAVGVSFNPLVFLKKK